MSYANIRDLLPIAGCVVVDVTQHDEIEWILGEQPAFFSVHFDSGLTLTVVMDEDGTHVTVIPPQ